METCRESELPNLTPRRDCAGLTASAFTTWLRREVGHSDRFHLALYRQLMATGRCDAAELPVWQEAERTAAGILARIAELIAIDQHPPVVRAQETHDAVLGRTTKLVMRLDDGLEAEAVVIPMRGGGHHTVCVSSQVGCKMGCTFCHTAKLGLIRHLTPSDIVGQVLAVRAHLGIAPRNVVFMGMGEPLDNLDNVAAAIAVLTDPAGLALAHRHVTISTVGRIDQFPRLAALGLHRVNLAVSLTAADDALRSRLMPVNRTAPLAELKRALLAHPLAPGRRILISYVLMAGVNDGADAADRLIAWVDGLRCLVNLIPFNAFADSAYRRPDDAAILAFHDRLKRAGVLVRLRLTKGDDVMAACGQLGNTALRPAAQRKAERET